MSAQQPPRMLAAAALVVGALLGVAGTFAPSDQLRRLAWVIFSGGALTPLSKPLPFFAYPFLAFTLFGWAWMHINPGERKV